MLDQVLLHLVDSFSKDPLYLTLNVILVGIGFLIYKLAQQAVVVLFRHLDTIENRFNEVNQTIREMSAVIKEHMSATKNDMKDLEQRIRKLEDKDK